MAGLRAAISEYEAYLGRSSVRPSAVEKIFAGSVTMCCRVARFPYGPDKICPSERLASISSTSPAPSRVARCDEPSSARAADASATARFRQRFVIAAEPDEDLGNQKAA
jgi:hypothetical protein